MLNGRGGSAPVSERTGVRDDSLFRYAGLRRRGYTLLHPSVRPQSLHRLKVLLREGFTVLEVPRAFEEVDVLL
jgi:hypothetical protein